MNPLDVVKGFDLHWRAPERLISIEDYRQAAHRRLPKMVWNYVDGGADDLTAVRDNRDAFTQWALMPRGLTGASDPKMTRRIADVDLRAPILLSPTGFTGLSRWNGDIAAARAAEAWGTRYSLSTASSWSIEEVFGSTSQPPWFQLYPSNGKLAANLLSRAEQAGCQVGMVTMDVPVVGNREGERKKGFGSPPKLTPARAANFAAHPRWTYDILKHGRVGGRNLVSTGGLQAALESVDVQTREFMMSSMNWDDVAWIRDQWKGTLYLKGVLHPEDAEKAIAVGYDGVIVSNHGGRQLDRAISTIDALPAIAQAVGSRTTVLLDGGIRRGTDIVTALALGADAVMIGRPYVYGLAVAGQDGVTAVLDILLAELKRALVLMGVNDIDQLGPEYLVHR
jgi:isopentenyl diphosphate isomerase/L-lactate dehydrogenase-like FMN-dependent dehydrogenase